MNKTGILIAAALAPIALAPTVQATAPTSPDPAQATLVGWSMLPTETYVPDSAPSGHWTTGNAAVPAPYPGQPVQGFSATHALADGSYLVMSDNGFGAKGNSADFELAVHRIRPDGETGATAYDGLVFNLSDPERHIPWQIWRDGGCTSAASLPAGYTCPARDRILTGWDFDPESMQIAKDGTYWFGEEFGPYLLHTNDRGELLEPPVPTPGVMSPSNPTLGDATPNLPNSKGYEGMAIAPNGRVLHPMLEGATAEDKAAGLGADLRIYTVVNGVFEDGFLRYRMESAAHALGDFIMINGHQALVIERDNLQGSAAAFKRIYLVDLSDEDGDGYVEKTLLVDLMNVRNPDRLGGFGEDFTFPYVTIEDVEIIDAQTIAVMNDNNFPAMGGRGADVPDVNEYLEIRLGAPLNVDRRLLPTAVAPGATSVARGGPSGMGPTTFALLGDTPYGDAQRAEFPALVGAVNEDRKVRMVLHAGDIKSGSSTCDDLRFADLAALYGTFKDPFVITPGDNEWTDCHRTAAGGYLPTERLTAFREVFYPEVGRTLGRRTMTVAAQPVEQPDHADYVENVRFERSDVVFATVHVVGSENDLAPWSQLPGGDRPAERLAEFEARRAANLAWIDATFERARAVDAAGVVLMMQAEPLESPGFTAERARILAHARELGRPVLLVHGDEHVYEVERQYAGVPNLTRLETFGDTATNWLAVTVDPRTPDVFSWQARSVS